MPPRKPPAPMLDRFHSGRDVQIDVPEITDHLTAIESTHGTRFACMVSVGVALLGIIGITDGLIEAVGAGKRMDSHDLAALRRMATQSAGDVTATMGRVLGQADLVREAMEMAREIFDRVSSTGAEPHGT